MRSFLFRAGVVAGFVILMQVGAAVLMPANPVSERAIGLPTSSPTPTVSPSSSASPTSSASHRPASRQRAIGAAAWRGPGRPSAPCGDTRARLVGFRIEVDRGLPTTPERFTRDVLSILCHERSWIAGRRVRFRYDPKGSLLIGLRSKENKDRICYPFTGYGSCQKPGQVVINADRWFGGSRFVSLTVSDYRRLVINHEVGHALGQRHRGCPTEGAPAPVMMQQSLGLTTDGRTCQANPWPLRYELRTVR